MKTQYCNKYPESEVLPDENGNCSLCEGNCTDNEPVDRIYEPIKRSSPQPKALHTKGELQIADVTFGKRKFKETIADKEQEIVAEVYGDSIEEAKIKAHRIVKCVNMHDDLIEELKCIYELAKNLALGANLPDLKRDSTEKLLKQSQQP